MPRIRMCDADRERYGGPEWVEISMAEILDEEAGLIELLNSRRAWDLSLGEFIDGVTRGMIRPTQAMIWLARRKVGCTDDPLTFRPKIHRHSGVEYVELPSERGDDADPPANRAGRRAAKKASKKTAASIS